MEVLLRLIDSCNRSRPHQVIVSICLQILHNISTFKSLVPYIVHIGQEPKRIATLMHIAQTYYTIKPPTISLSALKILTLIVRRLQPAQRKILFAKNVCKTRTKTKGSSLLASMRALQQVVQRKCKGKATTSTIKSRRVKNGRTKADETTIVLKRCLRSLSQVIHLSQLHD